MKLDEYKKLYLKKQSNKFHAKKAMCGQGHYHDSTKEAERCDELHLLLKAGEISNLELQKEYIIIPAAKYESPTKDERAVCYKADFVYFSKSLKRTVIEDSKGHRTKDYIIKRKLVKQLYCQDGNTVFIET
jgi:hypothetical protein